MTENDLHSNSNIKIGVFNDPAFKALSEYHAGDVGRVLDANGSDWREFTHAEVESLLRSDCDIFIIPYLTGEFSEVALERLVTFHAAGGSLLFLGDLPHRERWYPMRNRHAYRFHLTCGRGVIEVEGLTPVGKEILGELKSPEFFKDKKFTGLRVTAFPPDITHPLIRNNSEGWELPVVVAIERRSLPFLGARLAVIGFNGGEPRENVDGAYQLPWEYDPGMLTREWPGCDHMVWRVVDWLRPVPMAGALDVQPVSTRNRPVPVKVLLRNFSDTLLRIHDIDVKDESCGKRICSAPQLQLNSGELRSIESVQADRSQGIHPYSLRFSGPDGDFDRTEKQRVLGTEVGNETGFGASTFWAFQSPQIPREFEIFCRQMMAHGCQYIRVNIPWEDVEPEPGKYYWSIPDQMLELAAREKIRLFFWMFPTTRGSGISDGGVPWWVLKEPAIDRYGNKGFFPTLWSNWYRDHYFAMIDAFTRRYAAAPELSRFVIDFGNSDFPYGYFYYGGDSTIFDHSPQEHAAFRKYLRDTRQMSLTLVEALFGLKFREFDEVPVPYPEQTHAWRVYLDFRTWSIQEGIDEIANIIATNAPEKLPPDLPGHGLGSIADLNAFFYDVRRRHWEEEQQYDRQKTRLHNSGREWGGEAWQVGGGYREYDDALFNSLRLNASYLTIPGPDLGVNGDELASLGYIRRSIMGAERPVPEMAVIDLVGWNDFQSLAHIASRMDQGTDLLCNRHRFDFSCYRLLALPADEHKGNTVTGGGSGMLLPADREWYQLLKQSVEKGLNLLIFPGTCQQQGPGIPPPPLREIFDLQAVKYGPPRERQVEFPGSMLGGTLKGVASAVHADGEVLLRDTEGEPLLVRQPMGLGSVLLAGYDNTPDSLDGPRDHTKDPHVRTHTLERLACFLGIHPRTVRSDQLNVWKEVVRRGDEEFLLVYSHLAKPMRQKFQIHLKSPAKCAVDLATGDTVSVTECGDGWHELVLNVHPRKGLYLVFRS